MLAELFTRLRAEPLEMKTVFDAHKDRVYTVALEKCLGRGAKAKMNNNLPETPLGKRLLDKSARRIPAPSGLWERVEQKRSKKTFSRHLFALVLATSIAGTGFALLRPRTAAWHLRNRAVTVGETLVSAQSPLTLAAAGIGALQLEPQLSLSEKKS